MPRWINLRKHVKALIKGDVITVAQGKWIVLRIFRIGQYSRYWNEERQEALGGPKWLYDDFLIQALVKPGSTVSATMRGGQAGVEYRLDTIGIDDASMRIYSIECTPDLPRLPLIGDRLYEEIEFQGKEKPSPPLHAREMWEIENAVLDHGDYGRPEEILLFTRRMPGVS
jgi:hypothetical protein